MGRASILSAVVRMRVAVPVRIPRTVTSSVPVTTSTASRTSVSARRTPGTGTVTDWPVATLRTYEGAAPARLVPQTRGRRLATMQGTMTFQMRCRIRYYMDAHCGRRLDLYALVMTAPSV